MPTRSYAQTVVTCITWNITYYKRLAAQWKCTRSYFKEGQEKEIQNKNVETTLTAYFKLNQIDSEARNYLYSDIPIHSTFDEKLKTWNIRQKTKKPIY